MWKCSVRKHTGRPVSLLLCLVAITFHTVIILYFLKEIIKINAVKPTVGFSPFVPLLKQGW